MQTQQRAPRFMLSIFARTGAAIFNNRNADPCGEFVHGRRKIDMLVIHDEAENTSAHAAAEAVKCLPLRIHMKRRRFFLMKWTERLETRSRALERKIRADDLDDVIGGGDLLDGF